MLYNQALSCIRDIKLEWIDCLFSIPLRLSSASHRGSFSMAKASKLDFVIEWFLL